MKKIIAVILLMVIWKRPEILTSSLRAATRAGALWYMYVRRLRAVCRGLCETVTRS